MCIRDRNRILEWALAGLPAISTDLCELTGELSREGLLFPIPVGDPRALADRVLELEGDPGRLRQAGERLKDFVLEKYSFEGTTVCLRDWVRDPGHAPDFAERLLSLIHTSDAADDLLCVDLGGRRI